MTVNKKKEFNKILYDILLKIDDKNDDQLFQLVKLILKYFDILNKENILNTRFEANLLKFLIFV